MIGEKYTADQAITAKWLDTLTLPDDEQDVDGEIVDASIEDNYVGKEWHGRFGDTFLVIVETADGCRAIVSQGSNCMKFDYTRREQLLSMIDALAQACRVK